MLGIGWGGFIWDERTLGRLVSQVVVFSSRPSLPLYVSVPHGRKCGDLGAGVTPNSSSSQPVALFRG
jgi:hypothetical protein